MEVPQSIHQHGVIGEGYAVRLVHFEGEGRIGPSTSRYFDLLEFQESLVEDRELTDFQAERQEAARVSLVCCGVARAILPVEHELLPLQKKDSDL